MTSDLATKNTDVLCEVCSVQLEKVSAVQLLSEQNLEQLSTPDRIVKVNLNIRMDDGEIQEFPAYRVQYNRARGPGKGGIRFHPDVHEDEVEELAFIMALKNALLDLPYGGAKGGVAVDTSDFSDPELERLSREYIQQFASLIGPHQDIPAPDMNTNARIMGWMVDEYERITGCSAPGVITGKPLELGGSKGRTRATSLGGAYILDAYLEDQDLDPRDTTVAIQGFGNVGSHLASFLHDRGLSVVATSDADGAIYNSSGLKIPTVFEHSRNAAVSAFPEAETLTNEELLRLDVDVLIPAAIGGVINETNANEIRANFILEMANGPVTPKADDVLSETLVLPDILCNAGGVTVSYFEWLQNLDNEYWARDRVHEKLKTYMLNAYRDVRQARKKEEISWRKAAYALAVDRVLKAEKARGNR